MSTYKVYKEAVLDHYRNPRNFGELKDPAIYIREDNPLCGDEVAYYIDFDGETKVNNVRFNGRGCAISLASASMLSETMLGKSISELETLDEKTILDNLAIEISPMRMKCAMLALEVLKQGLDLYKSGASKRVQDAYAAKATTSGTSEHRHALPDLVGNTPLIRLNSEKWGLGHVRLFAKAEWFNPGGSAMSRSVLWMIRNAIKRNQAPLLPGMTILDATTGASGLAVAMFGASMGFPTKLVMPASTTEETKAILRAYGAKLMVLLEEDEGIEEAQRVAKDLYKADPEGHCYLEQYNNPANWKAHYETTGPEIIDQTGGDITHFVCGVGTGGTLVGTARRLKEHNSAIKVVGVHPDSTGHGIEGLRFIGEEAEGGIYDPSAEDESIQVGTEEAETHVRLLAQREGLLVGTSSGAALAGALKLAKSISEGTIVTVFPDGGERYLNRPHWLMDF